MKTIEMKKFGLLFLTACLGGAFTLGAYKLAENKFVGGASLEDKQQVYFANNPYEVTSSTGDLDFTQAAAAVTPAVVHIKTTYSGSNQQGMGIDPFEDMFRDFFGNRRRSSGPVMASGSGVILSDDGYIVTNNHVVENADKIEVVLNDKRSFQAKVIGRDANTDLALIKVSAKGLPIVKMGNSDDVRVGEWVLAVGNPFNLTSTVTAGIVSAKGRSIGILGDGQDPSISKSRPIEAFIQTDAAINRGNSGGALVNTKGELIGINAAIASQTGNYEGYGFAIPINLAKKVMDDFQKFGTVQRGFLGVSIGEITAELAEEKGLKSTRGVYVASVVDGGAAASAGLKEGDVIVKIEGVAVNASSELQEQIGRHRPGDKITIAYVRGGVEKTTSVVLKSDEGLKLASSSKSTEEVYNKLGASFAPAGESTKKKYGINNGLVVTEVRPGGLFEQIDLPKGTIITGMNGRAVAKVDDIDAALSNRKNDMLQITGISPDGSRINYTFQVR
jgi:Do/DeqQ family serine protease